MSRLGSLLVREGILSASDRQLIKRESANHHGSFARSILALGLLDEVELSALFTSNTSYRQAEKDILQELDLRIMDVAPLHVLSWLEVLPLHIKDGTLVLAMVDPTDLDAISQMVFFTGYQIRPVIATQSQINFGLKEIGAVVKIADSRFESFIKTHGRMSQTKQKPVQRNMNDESEYEFTFDGTDLAEDTDDGANEVGEIEVQQSLNSGAEESGSSEDEWVDSAAASEPDHSQDFDIDDDRNEIPKEEATPAFVKDESQGAVSYQKAALPEEDFSGIDNSIDFDLDDDGNEIPKAVAAPAVANDESEVEVSVAELPVDDIASGLESDIGGGLEGGLDGAVAASADLGEYVDVDVDVDPGISVAGAVSALPDGLDDDIDLGIQADPEPDNSLESMAGMDDETPTTALDGASENLALDGDDLMGGVEDVGLEVPSEDDLFEPDEPRIDGLGLGASGEQPAFEDEMKADGDEPTLDFSGLQEDSDASMLPSLDNEPLGMQEDTPMDDVPGAAEVAKASIAPIAPIAQPAAVVSAHAGITVLNRALVQMQMTSDPEKALQRIAEVSAKVGISSGAIVSIKGGKLSKGILWQQAGDGPTSEAQIPAGIDLKSAQIFAEKTADEATWAPISAALGASAVAIIKSWPDAKNAPTMVLARTHGDTIVLSFASFSGASDHDGLKQSFADVIRSVSPKL